MTTHGLTGLAVAHLPRIRGGDLTRLSWRGWHIDLDEQRVTVPSQPVAGKNIDDFDLLLAPASECSASRPPPGSVLSPSCGTGHPTP
jgi:hypothetical protein